MKIIQCCSLCVVLLGPALLAAHAEENAPEPTGATGRSAPSGFVETVKHDATVVGEKTKAAAKKVSEVTKRDAKAVAAATKNGAHKVGSAVAHTATKVKDATVEDTAKLKHHFSSDKGESAGKASAPTANPP